MAVVPKPLFSRGEKTSPKARHDPSHALLSVLLHQMAGSERFEQCLLVWYAGGVGDQRKRVRNSMMMATLHR